MTEGICSPANSSNIVECFVEPVHSDGVLSNNIVVVANSLVIFHPAHIGNLVFATLEPLFKLFLLCAIHVIIPIFNEVHFSHEVSSIRSLCIIQSFIHGVEYLL